MGTTPTYVSWCTRSTRRTGLSLSSAAPVITANTLAIGPSEEPFDLYRMLPGPPKEPYPNQCLDVEVMLEKVRNEIRI